MTLHGLKFWIFSVTFLLLNMVTSQGVEQFSGVIFASLSQSVMHSKSNLKMNERVDVGVLKNGIEIQTQLVVVIVTAAII